MPKSVVGLYLGEAYVDIVKMKSGLGGPRIDKFAHLKLSPEEAKLDDETKDVERKAAAIQRALKEGGVAAEEVCLALPGRESLVRIFEIPRIPKSELETVVRFEAKKYIPFKLEEIVSDYLLSIKKSKTNKFGIVFVAAKKEVVEKYFLILKQAGLKLAFLEIAPFSLMRALQASGQINREETTAVVDLDGNKGDINILLDGLPSLTRDFSLKLPVDFDQERDKAFLQGLISEILVTLNYFARQSPGKAVNKLIFCGGDIPNGWDERLSGELGIPVNIANPFETFGPKEAASSGLSIAVGLALREMTKPIACINLGSKARDVARAKEELIRSTVISISMAALILVSVYVLTIRQAGAIRSLLQQTRLETESKGLSLKSLTPSDLEMTRSSLESRKTALSAVIDDRVRLSPKLEKLPGLLPEGMWLRRVKFQCSERQGSSYASLGLGGSVYLGDRAKEMQAVNDFLAKLKGTEEFSKLFTKINLVSVAQNKMGRFQVVDFEIGCAQY